MEMTTIGLDIAKSVFQVHGVDARGTVVLRKRLARTKVLAFFANLPRCMIGLEAGGGAHHWARELQALGHDARLMPPQDVKAYVKANQHDAADAEACCEAVQRPGMRFVTVKTKDQQATLMLHRVRDQLIGQRTATIPDPVVGLYAAISRRSASSRHGVGPAYGSCLPCSARSRTIVSHRSAGRCCRPSPRTCGISRTRSPSSTAGWWR
jgi:transposase